MNVFSLLTNQIFVNFYYVDNFLVRYSLVISDQHGYTYIHSPPLKETNRITAPVSFYILTYVYYRLESTCSGYINKR